MEERLEAHFENRIYYFFVVSKKPDEISISMYNTRYILIQKDGRWVNHFSNKMNMADGLIGAVVVAVG